MSSSAVSQLLQITFPRADSKPAQAGSSPDGQFQVLLARASSTAESQPKQTAESNPLQDSDEPLTDTTGHDESSQYDDASANSDVPNDILTDVLTDVLTDSATDTHEPSEESLADTVELSETVELVLAANRELSRESVGAAKVIQEPLKIAG